MKELRFLLLTPALMLASTATLAQESQHWVCQTEPLYRQLLSARLYGVGKDPEQGCQKLPTGISIEQLECVISDLELCQYRWQGLASGTTFWGSPIIKTVKQATE